MRRFGRVDTLQFIAEIVRALAWPVAVVVLVLLLRESLTKVLSRPGLRQLKAGPSGVEAVWEETLTEAKVELQSLTAGGIETQLQEPARDARLADLEAIVEDQPRAAIMEAFTRVEVALRERLHGVAGETPSREGARGLVRRVAEADAISEETVRALDGLIVLRNLAAHGGGEVTPERAVQYLALADSILYVLTRER